MKQVYNCNPTFTEQLWSRDDYHKTLTCEYWYAINVSTEKKTLYNGPTCITNSSSSGITYSHEQTPTFWD